MNKHSELLINHVNYFDGKELLNYLLDHKFSAIEYYNYQLKTTLRGRGWQVKSKLMASLSQKKSADFYINEKIGEVREFDFNKKEILHKWYINDKRKYITYLMSWYHHANFIKFNPEFKIGHETYALFKTPEFRFASN